MGGDTYRRSWSLPCTVPPRTITGCEDRRWPGSPGRPPAQPWKLSRASESHLHEEDDHDNLQADPGLPERLQLVPLVGHHVGPPNRDGLLAPDLPCEGGSLPVQEKDVH